MLKKGQLEVLNLHKLIESQSEYTNFIVSEVNDHALRIAVINGEFTGINTRIVMNCSM
jgi:hypothetical protein